MTTLGYCTLGVEKWRRASESASDVPSCECYTTLPWRRASESARQVSLPVTCQAVSLMQPDRLTWSCRSCQPRAQTSRRGHHCRKAWHQGSFPGLIGYATVWLKYNGKVLTNPPKNVRISTVCSAYNITISFSKQQMQFKKVSLFPAFLIFFTAAQKKLHTTCCHYILCSIPLTSRSCTAQYSKCVPQLLQNWCWISWNLLVLIYLFSEMKLRGHIISKTEFFLQFPHLCIFELFL